MKELIKPNLTEKKEGENNEVSAYCDLWCCEPVGCFLWACFPILGEDEGGDILF